MTEEQLAAWRGRTDRHRLPVLPARCPPSTAAENAALPLDLARIGLPASAGRRQPPPRPLSGSADRGDQLPLELSGGSSSASRSPGRWPASRPSCWATSSPATSTPASGHGHVQAAQGAERAGHHRRATSRTTRRLARLAYRIVSVRDGLVTSDTRRRVNTLNRKAWATWPGTVPGRCWPPARSPSPSPAWASSPCPAC